MSFKIQRKIFKIGQSHAVTLPAGWCNFYGDRVRTVTLIGHSILLLVPKGLEEEAHRLIKEVERMDMK